MQHASAGCFAQTTLGFAAALRGCAAPSSPQVTRPRGVLRGAALLLAIPTLLLGALLVLPVLAPGGAQSRKHLRGCWSSVLS